MQGKIKKQASKTRKSTRRQSLSEVLPTIPDKRYFTIGEVALLCAIKPHVLRYWEQEFTQLSPLKRRGNRRYYQYNDVILVRKIRDLLYEQGFTIEGARVKLASDPTEVSKVVQTDAVVKKLIVDLEEILTKLKSDETS